MKQVVGRKLEAWHAGVQVACLPIWGLGHATGAASRRQAQRRSGIMEKKMETIENIGII